jgi:ABC-type dipeptide/oligopeptide/nickel transport system ATPase subunit
LTRGEINSVFLDENELEVITDFGIQTLKISDIFGYQNYPPHVHLNSKLKTIPANQNSLVLNVKANALQHPNDNTFYYQLNGQDTVPISDSRIYLMNLSSGSYKLNLLAYNGLTNSWTRLNSYSFTKEKAFWEKAFFWIILGSIISLLSVVIYYRTKLKRNKRLMEQRALDVLRMVGVEEKAYRMPHELSGGEQQRVAIARALLNQPSLILADEPTGNLDPETSEEIMRLMLAIAQEGTAVLMATHDMSLVEKFPGRVLRVIDGTIKEVSSIDRFDPFTAM